MFDLDQLNDLAGLPFVKMTGTGNDFIVADNTSGRVRPEVMPLLARAICPRRLSAGADGLILLRSSDRVDATYGPVDFAWDFFNADGSSAEMCGNGGRCAARFAFDQGLAGDQMVFDTLAGPIRAWVDGPLVKLEMVGPSGYYQGLILDCEGVTCTMDGINTGVPHAVLASDDVDAAPVVRLGRAIRFHPHFAPAGTNVNFAAVDGDQLVVRTYERGVEDETLACGTGVVASALTLGKRLGLKSPVRARVRSGEVLKVHYNEGPDGFSEVFLEGAASYVYRGVLEKEAWEWMRH